MQSSCQIKANSRFLPTGPQSAVGSVSNCRSRIAISISALSHTFVEIDHEIITTVILFVHEVLVNHLVKLAQEKSVLR